MQCFLNKRLSLVEETSLSLKKLGALSQVSISSKAVNILIAEGIPDIENIEEYIEEALEEKFEDIDLEYYSCEPELSDLPEEYLKLNEDEFLIIEST
ncbi:hypothetical protein SDC9_59764 [bioreactor metagenome]|uniref:DNA mimic protein DMP19 C-terminal domain-containing protein n=1 Tax=bioreactor metagenome TaxID=1076179 RepID=A0A644XBW9_9ZZZZ